MAALNCSGRVWSSRATPAQPGEGSHVAPSACPQPARFSPSRVLIGQEQPEPLRSRQLLRQTGLAPGERSQPCGQLPEQPVLERWPQAGSENTIRCRSSATPRGPWLETVAVTLSPTSRSAHLSARGASTFIFLGFGSSSAAAIFVLPPHLGSGVRPTPSAP